MAKTMPPLAVESSLVRTIPVRPTASWNAFAWARPFWPVVASRTNSVSGSRAGQALVDDPADLRQLVHEVRLRVEPTGRVGDDQVGAPGDGRIERVVDDRPGSAPGAWATTGTPARSAQIRSWSMAAARNVSAAARMIERPSPRYRAASLPIVVVLPVPLTPTTSTTAGPPAAAGCGAQSRSRAHEQRRQLGADGRLRTLGVAPSAGALDEVDGQRRSDVAGDERLLDVVPGRSVGAAQVAPELGHERRRGSSRALIERVGGRDGEERGRVEGCVCG